ncbi:MAG: hypothetical protein KGL93_10720 [Gemmatimonadota bacterium]|nr:hypothetical protein [Gemmatimonadota bacterium]
MALRFSPVNLADFIGEPLNAARNSSSLMARNSAARVFASFSAITARGSNLGSFTA